jgi:heme-degrading monooxygenase HmoA
MIAVIFEAFPKQGKWEEYLHVAASLRTELNKVDGFISIERFQSMTEKEKVLSLSFWKDEQSVAQWRNVELHRQAQANGRSSIFNDYRLRVAQVIRDYSMTERREAPADSIYFHKK